LSQPDSYSEALEGAQGVICCIGGFGTNEQMLQVNGEANMRALEAAAGRGIPRAVFISAHDYKFPSFVLSGYFQGKRNVEDLMRSLYPESGVILRPGFIHGTRMVGSTPIPLGLFGQPIEKVLEFMPSKSLSELPLAGAGFVPPVSVEKLAKVAVSAATDPAVEAGIWDVWKIKDFVS